MKNTISIVTIVTFLTAGSAFASDNSSELRTLLNQHKNAFEQYLSQNKSEAHKFCPLILNESAFYQWAEDAGVGTIARTKIMRVCQNLSLDQADLRKTTETKKPVQEEEKIELAEGFVKNYDLYATLFNKETKPRIEDIKELKNKYFNFEIDSKTGLQEQARNFVRTGKLRQLLNENAALIGSIAQAQAYFGDGQWGRISREKAQTFDPSPILKMDYRNPHGAMQGRAFDVTIYSFFHTILEQADHDLPRDEETYSHLLNEIKKGIRVRHMMSK